MRTRPTVILTAALSFVAGNHQALAVDSIPATSGFSGFILVSPGYFNVESNQIVTGAPLLDDVGTAQIDSIFSSPSSKTSPALTIGAELNYTFASTRTQLYYGNRLEDVLRLDIAVGLGLRQELPDESVLSVSLLNTPLDLEVWSDPYIEGERRKRTELNVPGARVRWGGILNTGLELTATVREYSYDEENGGDWLVDQGRLESDQQHLLDRDGDAMTLQALYRIEKNKNRFEPAVRYIKEDLDGSAVELEGYSLQLTYLYLSPKVVIDTNLIYGVREATDVHPVYGKVLDTERWGTSVTAFIPIKKWKTSQMSVLIAAEVFWENANIDFYDSRINSISVGLLWRHNRN
jgi:hypothetical protein